MYPRANVLLSSDFRYFGKEGTDSYKQDYPAVGRAVDELGAGIAFGMSMFSGRSCSR
jgi:hypothetical protein